MLSRCVAPIGALLAIVAVPLTALAALTASTADLTFAALAYSHDQQVSSGSLTLTATDTGDAGLGLTNSGWSVTLLASDFVHAGEGAGNPIPAANLAIILARPPTRVSGQTISPTGGPRTTAVTGSLDVARKTLQADGPSGILALTYHGIGTYRQAIDLNLTVPGQAAAGTYTSTLTVTMTAGP